MVAYFESFGTKEVGFGARIGFSKNKKTQFKSQIPHA